MNFAMSRSPDGNSINLIVCTYDALWSNKCELRSVTLVEELKWASIGQAYSFDMEEGMCAHKLTITS